MVFENKSKLLGVLITYVSPYCVKKVSFTVLYSIVNDL
jgi:hypothetical protein